MIKLSSYFIISFLILSHFALSQSVNLTYDKSLPQAVYAAETLEKNLTDHGYSVKKEKAEYLISLKTNKNNLGNEAYTIQPQGKQIIITGGDGRGLIYGTLSLVEDVHNGTPLQQIKPKSEYTVRVYLLSPFCNLV
jgi:N-acetyl-beta-hexosaminidase